MFIILLCIYIYDVHMLEYITHKALTFTSSASAKENGLHWPATLLKGAQVRDEAERLHEPQDIQRLGDPCNTSIYNDIIYIYILIMYVYVNMWVLDYIYIYIYLCVCARIIIWIYIILYTVYFYSLFINIYDSLWLHVRNYAHTC